MKRWALFCPVTLLLCFLWQPTYQQQPPVRPHNQQQDTTRHHNGHNHRPNHKLEEAPKRADPMENVRIIVPNLPPSHYQFWLKNHPRAFKNFEQVCRDAPQPVSNISDIGTFQQLHKNLYFQDQRYLFDLNYGKKTLALICSKLDIVRKSCWGYENNCQEIYLMPECLGTSYGEARDEQEQKIKWFTQADFGYILERRKEMSKYCAPDKRARLPDASSFECTKHFATCRGDNLFLHIKSSPGLLGAREELAISKVGGRNCDLQVERIKEENGRRGPLESWFGELEKYHLVDPNEKCDLTIDKEVLFVKINSTLNLYDYLGTFINLYATLHLNNRFSDDTQIVIWNKRLPRHNRFEQMWYAFSKNRPISAGEWAGKRVCVKNFIFAMPPKMVDGLHNRKSLIEGCSKSGLYNALHKHFVHRLDLPVLHHQALHNETRNNPIHVALLSRSENELRVILNEDKLIDGIRRQFKYFYVQKITYNSMDSAQVQASVLNSDILIGIHGAGLSYALFAPDWATMIELHDCGKPTYKNIARLRGLSYFTDKDLVKRVPISPDSPRYEHLNQSHLLDHDEFSNYEVNLPAFMKLFGKAKERLLSNRDSHFKKEHVIQSPTASKSTQTENPADPNKTLDAPAMMTDALPTTEPTTTTAPPPTTMASSIPTTTKPTTTTAPPPTTMAASTTTTTGPTTTAAPPSTTMAVKTTTISSTSITTTTPAPKVETTNTTASKQASSPRSTTDGKFIDSDQDIDTGRKPPATNNSSNLHSRTEL